MHIIDALSRLVRIDAMAERREVDSDELATRQVI